MAKGKRTKGTTEVSAEDNVALTLQEPQAKATKKGGEYSDFC